MRRHVLICSTVALGLAATVGLGVSPASALGKLPGSIIRVDSVTGGGPPEAGAQALGVSSSGRYVLWETLNTAAMRHRLIEEYYVTDTTTGVAILVSRTASGAMLTGLQTAATLSADGRYVAFISASPGLPHPANPNEKGQTEVYRYDLQTGDMRTESLTAQGTRPTGSVFDVGISATGRYVVYTSTSTDLPAAADIAGPVHQVYLYDNLTHQTSLISRATDGAPSDKRAWGDPQVSADGRYVAFASAATDLVSPALHRGIDPQIYLADREASVGNGIRLISLDSSGQPFADGAENVSLDATGTVLAYDAYNRTSPINREQLIYRYDIADGTTTIADDIFGSRPIAYQLEGRATISSDGRYVGYELSPLGSSHPDTAYVLRYDSLTGTTRVINRPGPRQAGQGFPENPPNSFLSGDGRHDAFTTTPPPISDPGDTNLMPDVYEWSAVSPH